MAKGKKKKKDLDFQKVKLKVGRKLKKDDNETKAEFKTRKIIIKEVKSYSDDPLTALAKHGDHISQHGKLSILNHFNSAITGDIVKSLNKPILDSLSKFLIDNSDQVRAATIKCLKNCFNHIRQQHLSAKEFLLSLKPYLDCAYTHISLPIVADCQKFLSYLVNINESQIFEVLMSIILRRYEAGNLNDFDRNLAIKLRQYYVRYNQKQLVEKIMNQDKTQPLYWTETNNILDLDSKLHFSLDDEINLEHEVYLVKKQNNQNENIVERYLNIIKDVDV